MRPLVTANIISYNNNELLYETIDSVIGQDYPNIELIISDDGSQQGFSETKVREYVERNKKENIRHVIVRRNSQNTGTVRHLELLRTLASGEYEISIGADDVWADNSVFTDFVNVFEKHGSSSYCVISQVQMMDEELRKQQGVFIRRNVIRCLKHSQWKKLLNIEAHSCKLPGLGMMFRRTIFSRIGQLGNDYYLVEDYPTHLRMLRLGIPIYYLDRICAKHRSGGISHGNTRNGGIPHIQYQLDLAKCFSMEVLPYASCFGVQALILGYEMYRYNACVLSVENEIYTMQNQQNAMSTDASRSIELPVVIDSKTFFQSVQPNLESYGKWRGKLWRWKTIRRIKLIEKTEKVQKKYIYAKAFGASRLEASFILLRSPRAFLRKSCRFIVAKVASFVEKEFKL